MRRPVEASAVVPAAPEAVYGFLSDLRNHWLLADRFVALGGLEGGPHAPTGGRVRMKGPFGLSREAKTRVLAAEPPTRDRPGMLRGVAEIGAATVGHVGWTIEQAGSGSRVSASVESASSSTGSCSRPAAASGSAGPSAR